MIYLFHGFNVSDEGEGTTDTLLRYLPATDVDYGYSGRLKVRGCTDSQSRIAAKMAQPGSIAIGHSNGCNIIHNACEYGAPFKKVIYINPALDNDLAPNGVEKFDVYYSPSDTATWLAKWIPFSDWGSMGRDGYVGDDPRGRNFNLEEIIGEEVGHSDAFKHRSFFAHIQGRIYE